MPNGRVASMPMADAVRSGRNVVLSPAYDGGYMLLGLYELHAHLFTDIPWSTGEVYRVTLERAREIGVPVVNVPGWYDVDDAASLRMLEDEFAGKRPPFTAPTMIGADAPATRLFMRERRAVTDFVIPRPPFCATHTKQLAAAADAGKP